MKVLIWQWAQVDLLVLSQVLIIATCTDFKSLVLNRKCYFLTCKGVGYSHAFFFKRYSPFLERHYIIKYMKPENWTVIIHVNGAYIIDV